MKKKNTKWLPAPDKLAQIGPAAWAIHAVKATGPAFAFFEETIIIQMIVTNVTNLEMFDGVILYRIYFKLFWILTWMWWLINITDF